MVEDKAVVRLEILTLLTRMNTAGWNSKSLVEAAKTLEEYVYQSNVDKLTLD